MTSGGSRRITFPSASRTRVRTPSWWSAAARARDLRWARRAGADELHGEHRATSPHLADGRAWTDQRVQSRHDPLLDVACPLHQVLPLDGLQRSESSGAGDRIPGVGPAESPWRDRVHELGSSGHRSERHAARQSLGRGE